ncbi:MAG: hydroxyacylglutathione hydrolase [Gammaproteobacteria bacterium]|nr:hydroxyacylglutathione hydrolase [Gammaproteobacteria bacterium]
MLNIEAIPALKDNYIWMIEAPARPDQVVLVDPGEPGPAQARLEATGKQLAAILVTHHHPDHTGGVRALASDWQVPVFGPSAEAQAVVTEPRADGQRVELGELGLAFEALHIPGHTLGHTAFLGHGALFCGDMLFSIGCGRLFEGTAEQMLASLERLAALPGETRVYAGHEYTLANLVFAEAAEPDNPGHAGFRQRIEALRADELPSLPSTIATENDLNPFLRCSSPAVRQQAEIWSGESLDDKVRVFAALRRWKDVF